VNVINPVKRLCASNDIGASTKPQGFAFMVTTKHGRTRLECARTPQNLQQMMHPERRHAL
jgi:hypothetical protein